jgi:hypothetical protein
VCQILPFRSDFVKGEPGSHAKPGSRAAMLTPRLMALSWQLQTFVVQWISNWFETPNGLDGVTYVPANDPKKGKEHETNCKEAHRSRDR